MTAAVDRVLPAGPATAARHPLFIATGSVVAAGTMLMFGMLAVWFKFRDASPLREGKNGKMIHDWLPAELKIPEVATNTLAITMVIAAIMGQWAVYSATRKDAQHTTLALFITGLIGVAAINGGHVLEGIKILTPAVGHAAGVGEVVFVHLFDVGGVAPEEISVACIGLIDGRTRLR
jgi:heme/copper-type cytochrome/quinol oxidase subunit 3